MYANSAFQFFTASQVSSRTHAVRTVSNPTGFFIGDSHMERIKLTQNQYALVDDEDYEELSKHKWYAKKTTYGGFVAARNSPEINGKKKTIRMHRFIMAASAAMEVDHHNQNTLDNQRHNLRVCTKNQNQQNALSHKNSSSRFKGVSWNKRLGKWCAQIQLNKKNRYLALFYSEEAAAVAYDKRAVELFGEFARLNFPRNEVILAL